MANNRLYLKCPKCGKSVCLGKSFGASFDTPYTGEPSEFETRINDFFEEHWTCSIEDEDFPDGGKFALEDEWGTYE